MSDALLQQQLILIALQSCPPHSIFCPEQGCSTTRSLFAYILLLSGVSVKCLLCYAVTSSTSSVDVILQDSTSQKLVAKARYTEQAPHTIRARATAYLTNAATAAKSAVQRVQTAAEHAMQRAEGTLATQSSSDRSPDIRHKAMASLTTAGATVRAAAHRLQLAADSVLRSSSAIEEPAEAADGSTDDAQVRPQSGVLADKQVGHVADACKQSLRFGHHAERNCF